MQNRKIEMYSAQAIAIVMVVLVVAAVLGASLYSRTIKNQTSVTNQEDSDIALEQADSLLNIFSDANIDDISTLTRSGDIVYEDIDTMIDELGFGSSATAIIDQLRGGNAATKLCEDTGPDSASGIKVALSRVPTDEYIDVSVGDSRNFNFDGITVTSGTLTLNVENRGTSTPVFAIKKIYMNQSTGDFKAYDKADNTLYCLGTSCPTTIDPTSSGTLTAGSVSVSLSPSTYNIYQVRVIPLVGDIAVRYSTTVPNVNFGYIKINAAVNCYGSYREKEMVIPSTESLGYPTIFDYVLYNNGTLSTN
jgi:hypothetical protein